MSAFWWFINDSPVALRIGAACLVFTVFWVWMWTGW